MLETEKSESSRFVISTPTSESDIKWSLCWSRKKPQTNYGLRTCFTKPFFPLLDRILLIVIINVYIMIGISSVTISLMIDWFGIRISYWRFVNHKLTLVSGIFHFPLKHHGDFYWYSIIVKEEVMEKVIEQKEKRRKRSVYKGQKSAFAGLFSLTTVKHIYQFTRNRLFLVCLISFSIESEISYI